MSTFRFDAHAIADDPKPKSPSKPHLAFDRLQWPVLTGRLAEYASEDMDNDELLKNLLSSCLRLLPDPLHVSCALDAGVVAVFAIFTTNKYPVPRRVQATACLRHILAAYSPHREWALSIEEVTKALKDCMVDPSGPVRIEVYKALLGVSEFSSTSAQTVCDLGFVEDMCARIPAEIEAEKKSTAPLKHLLSALNIVLRTSRPINAGQGKTANARGSSGPIGIVRAMESNIAAHLMAVLETFASLFENADILAPALACLTRIAEEPRGKEILTTLGQGIRPGEAVVPPELAAQLSSTAYRTWSSLFISFLTHKDLEVQSATLELLQFLVIEDTGKRAILENCLARFPLSKSGSVSSSVLAGLKIFLDYFTLDMLGSVARLKMLLYVCSVLCVLITHPYVREAFTEARVADDLRKYKESLENAIATKSIRVASQPLVNQALVSIDRVISSVNWKP